MGLLRSFTRQLTWTMCLHLRKLNFCCQSQLCLPEISSLHSGSIWCREVGLKSKTFLPAKPRLRFSEFCHNGSCLDPVSLLFVRDSDPMEGSEHILALNKHGVHFLDLITHETILHYPFTEVISTRQMETEDGVLFLDMKCGNLMQQRISRIQTDQAVEIARLIKQYITIDQRSRGLAATEAGQSRSGSRLEM